MICWEVIGSSVCRGSSVNSVVVEGWVCNLSYLECPLDKKSKWHRMLGFFFFFFRHCVELLFRDLKQY
jgi:hypothetical protein